METTDNEPRGDGGSSRQMWIGRIIGGLAVLFLVIDAAIKLVPIQAVHDTLVQLGYPGTPTFARGLGVLALVCTLLYLIPRTALLGAILWTGYLGGAIASNLRVGNPLLSHILFGFYLGLMLWGGLWLRNRHLRNLLPLRR